MYPPCFLSGSWKHTDMIEDWAYCQWICEVPSQAPPRAAVYDISETPAALWPPAACRSSLWCWGRWQHPPWSVRRKSVNHFNLDLLMHKYSQLTARKGSFKHGPRLWYLLVAKPIFLIWSRKKNRSRSFRRGFFLETHFFLMFGHKRRTSSLQAILNL